MWGDWLPRPLNRWKYCENGTRWRSAVLGDELKDHVAALIWSWMNLHPIVDESWKDIIYTGYTHVKGLLHKQVWFRTVCVCQCMSFRVCDLGASGLSSQEIQLQKVATKSWFIANYWAMKPWNGCLLFSTRVSIPPKSSVELVAGNWWYDQDAGGCGVFFWVFPCCWLGNMSRQCVIFFRSTLIQTNLPPCYSILHDHDIFFLKWPFPPICEQIHLPALSSLSPLPPTFAPPSLPSRNIW